MITANFTPQTIIKPRVANHCAVNVFFRADACVRKKERVKE